MISTQTLPHVCGIDAAGAIYWHELDGVEVSETFATTGPLEIGGGDKNMAVSRIYPDIEAPVDGGNPDGGEGQVSFQFTTRQMPVGRVTESPEYLSANPTMVRVLGRDVMMEVRGVKGKWELGRMRLEVAPVGTGKR